jgi:Na+/H+ antiporter NhaD/arsenite permease-like protein
VHPYLVGKSLLALGFIVVAYMSGVELVLTASLGAALLLITRRVNPNKVYVGIDFNLLVIFTGLFVIVGGVEKSGLMEYVVSWLPISALTDLRLFAILTMLVSNLVSNVPAVLLLKFFVPLENAELWWKSLAIFSTLAGNLTITGSVANLIVAEIAKRNNVPITASDYVKAGLPLTLITTAVAMGWIMMAG